MREIRVIVTDEIHSQLKLHAFENGMKIQDVVRLLLEEKFSSCDGKKKDSVLIEQAYKRSVLSLDILLYVLEMQGVPAEVIKLLKHNATVKIENFYDKEGLSE